jgi:branched-chain amino acid transport system ATP-binding protein
MKLVCGLADEITVLDCGLKIAEGFPEQIQNNPVVIEAYLGGEAKDTSRKQNKKITTTGKVSTEVLCLENINTFYGEAHILHDISFSVKSGEFVALIGANGAGKTTLLKTISGMLKPKSGKIFYNGNDVTASPDFRLVANGMVHVPEGRGIFPQLTVRENIMMGAYLRKDKVGMEQDYQYAISLFPRLQERISQKGGSLSGGEQQMLAISRALMARPTLLLLDEPSMGLSPKYVEEVFNVLNKIHHDGQTLLLVEQNAKAALSVAERAFVVEVGSIVLEGCVDALEKDPKVRSAYLGG